MVRNDRICSKDMFKAVEANEPDTINYEFYLINLRQAVL
jgi:hypothetical protein